VVANSPASVSASSSSPLTTAGLLAGYGLLLVSDRLAGLTALLQGGVAPPG
jgi:hypothetical protein